MNPPPSLSSSSSSSSQIKGGGRAVMSVESQEALIRLLIKLFKTKYGKDNNSDNQDHNEQDQSNEDDDDISQREMKQFVKLLVKRYQRQQLERQFNQQVRIQNDDNQNANNITLTTPATKDITTLQHDSIKSSSSSAAPGNVRIEIVEAIFASDTCKKESSKDVKHCSDKKKSNKSSALYKEGTKKVMVLPRSTHVTELCKQARHKLNIKSSSKNKKTNSTLRAFIKVEDNSSKTSSKESLLVDLEYDLSCIIDGTTIYITNYTGNNKKELAAPATKTALENDYNNSNDNDSDEIMTDPLDQVKQVYAQQERNQRRQQQQQHHHQSSSDNNFKSHKLVIDQNMVNKWAPVRSKLPAASYKSEIIDAIRKNPVVIICGSTGCGKSTQVPQFLLEQDMVDTTNSEPICTDQHSITPSSATVSSTSRRSRRPYIVVTQPRRVAAISLAQRVAEEMGSPPPGEYGSLVGYMVRLDRRVAEGTCRIIYCTVGVLLRMLVCPKNSDEGNDTDETNSSGHTRQLPLSLDTISHLIIDEVHERDVNTDFSLTLIRGFLASKQFPHLRLILMSATASADFFVKYFTTVTKINPPTSLVIPGRSFPVQIQWLSECEIFAGVKHWGSNNDRNEDSDFKLDTGPKLSPHATQKIDNHFVRSLIKKIVEEQRDERHNTVSESSLSEASQYRETGSILVFLPGRAEIETLSRCLYEDHSLLGDRKLCKILKLYSSISRPEQQIVFQPVPVGMVKIVLSTNIAETSVTIPDVTHVIDTGRVKESRFNASTRIKELVTVWTSQASATQRSGRAGRTSSGVCWRLYSEDFHRRSMLKETPPEMVRTPLDELILQICLLYEQRRDEFIAKLEVVTKDDRNNDESNSKSFPVGVRPVQFLSKTPSPPPEKSLLEGCRHLMDVDALRIVQKGSAESTVQDESSWFYRLTPLGYHISRLPMDAKVGKVLIVGCIMGCLDGALTVAAALSCTKSCILPLSSSSRNPNAVVNAIIDARKNVVENGFGGRNWIGGEVKGDLIGVIALYRAWKKQKSEKKCWEFCKSHGLDHLTLKEIDQLRKQFLDLLADAGFVPKMASKNKESLDLEDCNQAKDDALLTSCCLAAGLYPSICTLMRPRKGGPKGGRLLTKDGDICRPQSSSFQRERIQKAAEVGKDAYGVFHSKQTIIGTNSFATSNNGGKQRPPEVFLAEVNLVSRFALLLFGGELEIIKNAIIVDGWLKFKVICKNETSGIFSSGRKDGGIDSAVLILAFRDVLDDIMLEHVLETCSSNDRKEEIRARHRAIIHVIRKLLADEN